MCLLRFAHNDHDLVLAATDLAALLMAAFDLVPSFRTLQIRTLAGLLHNQ